MRVSNQVLQGPECNPILTQRRKEHENKIVPMAETKPTCFSSIQEGKGAQGNMANVNQKGKPMSRGQGVKIRDYFQKSEANPEKGEEIKGNQASKIS